MEVLEPSKLLYNIEHLPCLNIVDGSERLALYGNSVMVAQHSPKVFVWVQVLVPVPLLQATME